MAYDNSYKGQQTAVADQEADSVKPQSIAANDETVRKLIRIWEGLLGLEAVGVDQDYFDLGGDSSLAVHMFAEIEKQFGVKLPLATLYDAPTIQDLASILRGDVSVGGWSPLVAIQPAGSRPPLFCFHGAGGNVLNYRDLSRHLGPDQPFYGLQCQGLDGSCEPLAKVEDMASLYIAEIRRVQPHGPYFLAGYCGGGTIAYEAAQQLHEAGEEIALLALFDTMNWSKLHLTVWNKSYYLFQKVLFHITSFLVLDSEGKGRFFREKLGTLKSRVPVWKGILMAKLGAKTSDAASEAWTLGRIWRTNDEASLRYVPRPFDGTITDFRPRKQYRILNKAVLKWQGLAQQGQEVVTLPVYPASMLMEPFVKHLAEALRKRIDAKLASTN
jgi:thioesterase domain-containing protein/acyl carrier protein